MFINFSPYPFPSNHSSITMDINELSEKTLSVEIRDLSMNPNMPLLPDTSPWTSQLILLNFNVFLVKLEQQYHTYLM